LYCGALQLIVKHLLFFFALERLLFYKFTSLFRRLLALQGSYYISSVAFS